MPVDPPMNDGKRSNKPGEDPRKTGLAGFGVNPEASRMTDLASESGIEHVPLIRLCNNSGPLNETDEVLRLN